MNGFIYDLDGVIALTEEIHKEAFDLAFSGFKIDMSKYNWDKDFAGKGHRYIINTVFGESPANDRLIDMWVYRYQMIAHKAKPVNGVLKYIKSKGVPGIIATGSSRKSAEIILRKFSINLPLVSMEDVPYPKPDPGLFLLASKRIDIDPEYCIVFEDSIYGIRAAKSAGMKVIALLTTSGREHILRENPDMIINDFTELISTNVSYPQFDER